MKTKDCFALPLHWGKTQLFCHRLGQRKSAFW